MRAEINFPTKGRSMLAPRLSLTVASVRAIRTAYGGLGLLLVVLIFDEDEVGVFSS